MTIAAANNLDVMTGDIGNAYLNANTQEDIYTRARTEFEVVGIMAEGTFMEGIKALYGLPTSSNRWNAHLSHTLREMVFKPTRFDPAVWIRLVPAQDGLFALILWYLAKSIFRS